MSLEIRHLKMVKAVAETGNLTKAGEMLFLSQSALSHQLKDIEETIGSPLFHRLHKKMVLTPIGSKILDSAELILHELEKTESAIKNEVEGTTGRIRISTQCYTCYHWLPEVLKSYQNWYPNVEVSIMGEATRGAIDALSHGKLDIAVVHDPRPDDNIHYEPIFQDQLVGVMSPAHSLASKKFLKAEDFISTHYLIYNTLVERNFFYKKILAPKDIFPAKVTRMELTEAILAMVKANMGISVLAEWALTGYLGTGEIITKPITRKGLYRTWYIATLKQGNKPGYMNCFLDHLHKKETWESLSAT